VVEGTLASLPGIARESRVRPPAMLIVGEVVRLRARLDWFGAPQQALSGQAA